MSETQPNDEVREIVNEFTGIDGIKDSLVEDISLWHTRKTEEMRKEIERLRETKIESSKIRIESVWRNCGRYFLWILLL